MTMASRGRSMKIPESIQVLGATVVVTT
jgi:hypothetical protein